jgi:CheY-like chemotaxis protein
LRRFIENSLAQRSSDYTVITAPDGEQGLERAEDNKPDLILLDFLLPDMNGDAVCEKLMEKGLGDIPVILLSSDAEEMQKAETSLANVRRSLTKPFTRDLLYTTVSHAVREIEAQKPAEEGAEQSEPADTPDAGFDPDRQPDVVLRGSTGMVSLIGMLRGVENDRLTGVLTCTAGDMEILLYTRNGLPRVSTTRDSELYLKSDLYQINIPDEVLSMVKQEQARDGFPCFGILGKQDLLDRDQVLMLCKEYGNALFARLWTCPEVKFVFTRDNLPEWLAEFPAHKGRMDDWAMSTLRQVGSEYQSAEAWGTANGIPCFTLRGYRSLQEIPLNDREIGFASQVSEGGLTLEQISQNLDMPVESTERILFRFMSMEVIDYWPGSIFKGEENQPDNAGRENPA